MNEMNLARLFVNLHLRSDIIFPWDSAPSAKAQHSWCRQAPSSAVDLSLDTRGLSQLSLTLKLISLNLLLSTQASPVAGLPPSLLLGQPLLLTS